jgi:hypothetical protein
VELQDSEEQEKKAVIAHVPVRRPLCASCHAGRPFSRESCVSLVREVRPHRGEVRLFRRRGAPFSREACTSLVSASVSLSRGVRLSVERRASLCREACIPLARRTPPFVSWVHP